MQQPFFNRFGGGIRAHQQTPFSGHGNFKEDSWLDKTLYRKPTDIGPASSLSKSRDDKHALLNNMLNRACKLWIQEG